MYFLLAGKCVSLNLGGPEFCKGNPQSRHNFSENVTPVINVTLCGVPAPILLWNFNDGVAENATRKAINYYTFEYSMQLPELTQETCGRKLALTATGNESIKEELLVFLDSCKSENISLYHFDGLLNLLNSVTKIALLNLSLANV